MVRPTAALLTLGLACAAPPALADDVTDAIDEALKAYRTGDLGYAKESLDFASQLIAQQKAGSLEALLPPALDGWTAGEATNQSMAALGGGSGAGRSYTRDSSEVSVRYMAGSPMIAQMAAIFSNPAMIGASGGRMVRFGRQTAMVTKEGDVQFIVDNRIMVQVNGNATEEEKLAYAGAVDLAALKEF